MNKYKIIEKIEEFAPIETAEKWDCVGFQVETSKIDVSKIMLCLTPNKDTINQAIQNNCDMLITHHPMFYIELSDVSKNNKPIIDIYSAHTNLDKAYGGTTDTIISALNLEKNKINIEHEFLRIIEFEQKITINEFNKLLSTISPNLRYTNNKEIKTLKKIAFCAGSGSEFIQEAKELGCDCLVTGDLKFHTAIDSEIVVYDIGHFESEILILPIIEKLIGKDVEIIYAKEKSPFIYPNN